MIDGLVFGALIGVYRKILLRYTWALAKRLTDITEFAVTAEEFSP